MASESTPSRRPLSDPSFRKLSKNDVRQTVEQWKERTLLRLGDVSGQWASWAKKDSIPTLPPSRPIAPVNPTSEGLIASLKATVRQRRLKELILAQPKPAEGVEPTPITIADVPEPNEHDAWHEYETQRAKYQNDLDDYQRSVKLAAETYPVENKKVFTTLIECISDSSVQDLKRTADGARFFGDNDSYSCFKLAIQEHEYLPPAISSAAVARARDDFEGLRQRSEDTITDHISEFRRLYEALLKARGPDGGSPYMDFDLRDRLANSLYKPVWGGWIATREATDTMPTTFEGLVLALKKAESTMALKGTCAMDLHMPSAHMTRTEKSDSSPTLAPTNCQSCGACFTPKRHTHVRCDHCQIEYSAKMKKEKKKAKGKDSKKHKTKAKDAGKRAHSTVSQLCFEMELFSAKGTFLFSFAAHMPHML